MKTERTGAVIAAAGMSSRMGHFKPLLPLGDRTIIEHVVGKLRQAGVGIVVVVTGHNSGSLTPVVERMGAVAVHNPDYASTGMYESLKHGMSRLQGECGAFFMQPCDMPLVAVETMRRQLAALDETGAMIVHPSYLGRKHGHPVLFSGKTIDTLLAYDGGDGLRAAIKTITGKSVDVFVEDQGILIDADRPQDYQALVARFNGLDIPVDPVAWPFRHAVER